MISTSTTPSLCSSTRCTLGPMWSCLFLEDISLIECSELGVCGVVYCFIVMLSSCRDCYSATGTTLQWNLSLIHPLLGPLYSGTSFQSTHYWDHSTVEPLSNPPTTGTTLQWNLFPIHPLLGPLYSGTSL